MKVSAGRTYVFHCAGFDLCWSHADVRQGQLVRVVNLPSAPRANTMGQCHIADLSTGKLLGMVDTRSLSRAPRTVGGSK